MQLELYNVLKTQLETLTEFKNFGLWNNQFEREKENVSFNYPCCFVEFTNIEYSDYLNGVQDCRMDVNIHLGFKSYKTEDLDFLDLKQIANEKLQGFSSTLTPYNTKLLRRSEIESYDHGNVQEYVLSYHLSGKDYSVSTLPSIDADITTLIINDVIKLYGIDYWEIETEFIIS